jgi:hypothetical protein
MQKNIRDMCKSSIFVFFDIITKCAFFLSFKIDDFGAFFIL